MARHPQKRQRVQAEKPQTVASYSLRTSSEPIPKTLPKPVAKKKPGALKSPIRGMWTEEFMQIAIQCIKSGQRSIRNASRFFSIPSSSIRDWMSRKTKSKRHGHDPYLTLIEEEELKVWCFKMQEMAFSVTLPILKNTVRDIVQCFPRKHPFKDDLPGQSWWECFKSRHPDVVLRLGEGLEMKRCIGLNHKSCSNFYSGLTTVITSHGYEASHIWNMDETGVQAAGKNSTLKVVAKKGSKNVNMLAGNNKKWLTIIVCISVHGTYIPPYYIFKGKYLLQDYMELCGPGAAMNVQENGWITNEIFCDWLVHFQSNVPGGVSQQNKHLLILDRHCSHVSATTLDTCIKMEIDIMSIPSHTSQKMQPLDVSCFKPFKQYLQEDKAAMGLKNPNWANGVMLRSTLAGMVASALNKALKPSTIIAGFKATGICFNFGFHFIFY